MKVYIAGKITGDADYRKKFNKAAEELEKRGHIALNPAMLPVGMEQEDYLNIDIAMMSAADCVYFLRDYIDSKGAMLELEICNYTGKIKAFEMIGMSEAEAEYEKTFKKWKKRGSEDLSADSSKNDKKNTGRSGNHKIKIWKNQAGNE